MLLRRLRGTGLPVLRRTLFISTETTPNPESLKFLPGREVLPEEFGTGEFFEKNDKRKIASSPLAKQLFDTQGIKNIFFGRDFISITKNPNEQWMLLKPIIFSLMFDFFSSGQPIMTTKKTASDTTILEDDSEIVATIKELMETKIRPTVQDDGGDIFFHSYDPKTGLVRVKLAGSCVGCPSSSITLKNGVENMLMHYIPEITGIEEAPPDEEDHTQKLEFHPTT